VHLEEAVVEQCCERTELLARGERPLGDDVEVHLGQHAERTEAHPHRVQVRSVDPVQLATPVDQPDRSDQRRQ
jgi:hypothetical protein